MKTWPRRKLPWHPRTLLFDCRTRENRNVHLDCTFCSFSINNTENSLLIWFLVLKAVAIRSVKTDVYNWVFLSNQILSELIIRSPVRLTQLNVFGDKVFGGNKRAENSIGEYWRAENSRVAKIWPRKPGVLSSYEVKVLYWHTDIRLHGNTRGRALTIEQHLNDHQPIRAQITRTRSRCYTFTFTCMGTPEAKHSQLNNIDDQSQTSKLQK